MTVVAVTVQLRPVGFLDRDLLFRVYASTRAEELAQVGWSDDQKHAFLRQQFDAQDRHWREHYTDTTWDVVVVDGRPAGRLYVARWEGEIRVVDVALLPEFRGRGVGEHLLRRLADEATASGRDLTVHVERNNPARSLYERLGFEVVEDRGVYLFLRRRS